MEGMIEKDGTAVVYLRVPEALVAWLDTQAAQAHRTRNSYMWHLLAEEKARKEAKKEATNAPA